MFFDKLVVEAVGWLPWEWNCWLLLRGFDAAVSKIRPVLTVRADGQTGVIQRVWSDHGSWTLGCPARVAMMQAAEMWNRHHFTSIGRFGGSSLWRVTSQALMDAVLVVVASVVAKPAHQVPLAQYDYLIQALAANRSDHPFAVTVLPRRLTMRCRNACTICRPVHSAVGLVVTLKCRIFLVA